MNMIKRLVLCSFIFIATISFAQNTIISATVQDPTGQAFMYGSFTVSFVRSPYSGAPTSGYCIHGNTSQCVSPGPYTGRMDNTGFFSTTLINGDNSQLTPAGSKWQVTVCPDAGAGGGGAACTVLNIPVTGVSMNLSTQLNAIVPNILVLGTQPMATAYKDSEIVGSADGLFYFRTSDGVTRVLYQGVWSSLGSGGGGASIAHTFNFISGDNAGNGIDSGVPVLTYGLYAPSYGSGDLAAHINATYADGTDCPGGTCKIIVPNSSNDVTTPMVFSTANGCPTIVGTPGIGTVINYTVPVAAAITLGCANFGHYNYGLRDFMLNGPGVGWLPLTAHALNSYILQASNNDGSCNIYKVTTASSASGTTEPTWGSSCSTLNSTCSSGGEVYTNFGPSIGVVENAAANSTLEGLNVNGFGCSIDTQANSWDVTYKKVFAQTYKGEATPSSGETHTFCCGTIFGGNVGLYTANAFYVNTGMEVVATDTSIDNGQLSLNGGGMRATHLHLEEYGTAGPTTIPMINMVNGGLVLTDSDILFADPSYIYNDNLINMVNGRLEVKSLNSFATPPIAWSANFLYPQNYVVHPTFSLNPGNFAYEATTPGMGGSSQPIWTSCQVAGCHIIDGAATLTALKIGNATGGGSSDGTGTVRTLYKIACSNCFHSDMENVVGGIANVIDSDSSTFKNTIMASNVGLNLYPQPVSISTTDGFQFKMFDPTQPTTAINLHSGISGTQLQSCYQLSDDSVSPSGLVGGELCKTGAGDVELLGGYAASFPTILAWFAGTGNVTIQALTQANFNVGGNSVAAFGSSSTTLNNNIFLSGLTGVGTRAVNVTAAGQLTTGPISSGTISPGAEYRITQYTSVGTGTVVGQSNIFTDATGNNLTIPGTATIGSGALKINGASILPNTQTLGTDGSDNMTATVTIIAATLMTTAASSNVVTMTGMTSSGHCSINPTNALASLQTGVTYISAKATNQVTVTHVPLSGLIYDILCTPF